MALPPFFVTRTRLEDRSKPSILLRRRHLYAGSRLPAGGTEAAKLLKTKSDHGLYPKREQPEEALCASCGDQQGVKP
jgi:hypothetical protein